jgi:hypothetical protein
MIGNHSIADLVKTLKMIGPWTGVRFLRNRGVPFGIARLMIHLLREERAMS